MNAHLSYRVSKERNVAAAFAHFHPPRHSLRAAAAFLAHQLLNRPLELLRRPGYARFPKNLTR